MKTEEQKVVAEEVYEALRKELEAEGREGEVEKNLAAAVSRLVQAIDALLGEYKDKVPEEIASALGKVKEWAASQAYGYPPPYGYGYPKPKEKSNGVASTLLNILARLVGLDKTPSAEGAKMDEEAKKSQQEEPKTEATISAVSPASAVPAPAQPSIEEVVAKSEAAIRKELESITNTLNELGRRVEALEKARGVKKSQDGQDTPAPSVPEFGKGMFADVLGFGPRE